MEKNYQDREEMFQMVEQCQSSGKTNKAYCQEQGIKQSVYYYWQKKYRDHHQTTSGFVPIKLKGEYGNPDKIEISYPNGIKVCLPHGTDFSIVKTLIGLR